MVKQDFISLIRAAEKQADEMISQAREQARLDLEQAREQAALKLAQARRTSELEYEQSLAKSEQLIAEIERSAGDIEDYVISDKDKNQAAKAVAERIVKYSVDR